MLYLKSLSLSKFKSFKTADLLFSKGFTCIVGPNGSGKSNICDALLFSLGESSLRRMRVDKLDLLINAGGGKAKAGTLATTHVKATFGGDDNLEVVRIARADGKSQFKVNGKTMTRHEVLEILKSHKMNIDETNTITQGEIMRMMDLNPKERRELIDIASGITEFEEKKKESLRELEKVNAKSGEVHAILNERLGYLKELEKEKEAAESYSALNGRLRLLKYNILVAREQEIKGNYDKYSKESATIDARKQKFAAELAELSESVNKLTSDRQSLTKALSETTVSASEENKKLESINKELSVIEVNLQNNERSIQEKTAETKTMKEEIEEIKKVIGANKEEIAVYQKRILELEPFFNDLKESGKEESHDNKLATINVQIGKLEHEFSSIQEIISALQADLSATRNSNVELSSRKELLESQIKEKLYMKNEIAQKVDAIAKTAEKLEAQISKGEARSREIIAEIGNIDTKTLSLKEQRAMSGSRESAINEKLANNFDAKDGFYGRVSQLCTYGSEYAMAIEASAGGRFDYFVVESIESASKVIGFLKKNDLGRATFIPIKDLSFDRERKKEQNLSAVIDMLKFDSKYSKVFEYVFSNTYIIDRVEDSKSVGVGKHRYVTLSGELVEQSGILSGGSAKKRLSLASIENQLKELSAAKEKLSVEAKLLSESTMKARKEIAMCDLEEAKISSTSSSFGEQIEEEEAELKKLQSTVKSYDSKLKELEAQISRNHEKKEKIVADLEGARSEASDLFTKMEQAAKAASKHGMSKEEKEKLNKMRTELQEVQVKRGQLVTQSEMSEKRRKEIEASIDKTTKAIEELKADNKDKHATRIALETSRHTLEEKIKNSSASGKETYEKVQDIEAKLAKLNAERGKRIYERDDLDRQINDFKVKIGQLEMRLSDIQAELASYAQTNFERLKSSVEEMEREASVTSVKIEQLGNVNLKAPEIYEIKKKDAEEANGRLETLMVEKEAVLKMIEEIDSKKLKIFMETFEIVNVNFTKLYNYIFPGKASIELEDPKNPFESGLHIKMVDGKTTKRENSLSGGEKSLVMLMLLFSIHMHKPSSLYIFDEVDSALDKENSKKLSHLIKEMSQNSQFVVVSHNDSLIVNADTAIGVAKMEGESRAVGLQVANVAKQQAAAPSVQGA
ncbi:MAG: chromosome segregation protein SMC [Candidatus Micrarchaeota archaeon]|nr:chromosome segregation protein SMC [Candidatus Micrarchaeota archaeon]